MVAVFGTTGGVVLGFKSGRPDGEDECLSTEMEKLVFGGFSNLSYSLGKKSPKKNTDGILRSLSF